MSTNYAEICRVVNLETDFQQVPIVHFFPKFSQYCYKTLLSQTQQRILKTIFLDKKLKKKKKSL